MAVERHGRWRRAIGVPGLAALNKGGIAQVNSVSCASAGNCAAGGRYAGGSGGYQVFVASERHGRWRRAIEVPGLAAMNKRGEDAEVSSVSCASAGNCAAGGSYTDHRNRFQGFVAVERHGRWGKAIGVPALAARSSGNFSDVESVSCAPAGSCVAGGFYVDRRGIDEGYVTVERDGRWGKAIGVPGLADLSKGGNSYVGSLSCVAAGSCTAGGGYGYGVFVTQAR